MILKRDGRKRSQLIVVCTESHFSLLGRVFVVQMEAQANSGRWQPEKLRFHFIETSETISTQPLLCFYSLAITKTIAALQKVAFKFDGLLGSCPKLDRDDSE